ncbi:MAG: CPBP family intramembrane glutamic endopeptidase [Ginsengibacter sp.]
MKNRIKILQAHPLLYLFTCITTGITEEIIFRGYLQTRIELIFKSPLAGIILSAIFLSLAHSTNGTAQEIAIPFMIGIIFSVYYFRYKNIYIPMAFLFFILLCTAYDILFIK